MRLMKSFNWQSLFEAFLERVGGIKRSQRLLIFFGSIILLGGAFYALDYMPKAEEIGALRESVDRLEQQLRTVKIRARNLKKFKAEYAAVKKEFQEALKLLPDKREIPNLLRSVSQMGTDAKLEFRLISPQTENSQDFYMEIPVLLELKGNFPNVTRFFDRVGRMDRIVNLINISMTPEKPLSTNLITKCTAITYRFKSKEDEKNEAQKKKKK